ncbi:Xylose isomerase [Eumeta japonica]|uniref:Xylose isomerase n=1 Tax=Eumeta variegata TaxID=151549 RepID=A0A4C1TZY3_EUMVA|nr:Xylose isomerase [Eumeta japonica]
MSACPQAGPKRQKMRDQRASDFVDYFQGIDRVEFKQIGGTNDVLYYNHYNSSERLRGRTMEEWLKFSVSFTAFKYNAFDTDLIPQTDNFDEYKSKWDEITDFILELSQRTHVKPLWIAPDLHSYTRYATGAATNNDVNIFVQAAAQTKKCLEMAHRLNTECFLFWPYREGYDNPFRCDLQREMKLLAKLFKMTAEYKERLCYRGQLMILPYYEHSEYKSYMLCENFKNDSISKRYMWDAMSCLSFLRHYNLERYYKICAAPGHQLYLTSVYDGLAGAVVVGDEDLKVLVVTIKAVIDQGSPVIGGFNLNVRPRRDSADSHDLMAAYIRCADAVARAFRVAALLMAEQMFSKHVQQKYSSFGSGPGARLAADLSLHDCEEHLKKNHIHYNDMFSSSKSEYWDLVFQRYLDGCTNV